MTYQDSSYVKNSSPKGEKPFLEKVTDWTKTQRGTAILAFVLGLFIGLVVLGWGPLKVKYVDTTPETLREDLRQDYVRMIIDSYSFSHIANPQYAEQMAIARLDQVGKKAMNDLEHCP